MTARRDITLDSQRRDARRSRVEPRRTLADAHPRRLRPHRHASRLRARRLRRLHRAGGRRAGALLPDVRGAGRRAARSAPSRASPKDGDLHPLQEAFSEHHGLQCGFCTPGFLMLAVGVLEREPGDQRRGAASRCCRRTCAAAPATRTSSRRFAPRPNGTMRCDAARSAGRSGGSRTGRSSPDRAASPPTSIPRPAPHARRALAGRAWPHPRHRHGARRWPLPGVVAVWTAADVADIPPIDFRLVADRGPRALSPADARERIGCAMSASRSPWCLPSDPYLAEDAAELVDRRHRGAAGRTSMPTRAPAEFDEGAQHRAGGHPQGLRRCRCRLRAARMRSSSSTLRSAGTPACRSRRAARIARYRRRRATSWKCTAPPRCRTATATQLARMLGLPLDSMHLHEGHVGGGFGIRGELYPEDVLVCARPRCASAGRSNGSRTGASI